MRDKAILAKMHCAVISDDEPIEIACAMYYAAANPMEVVFITDQRTAEGDPCEWHYARDLLVAALNGSPETIHGEGDVQTFKEGGFLYTMLSQGDNKVILAFMQSDIRTFLLETDKICAIGSERVPEADIDAAIEKLLAED